MAAKIRHKFRIPGLAGVLSTLGGVLITILKDPHILSTVAGKIGIPIVLAGAIVQAVTQPVTRTPEEAAAKAREENY